MNNAILPIFRCPVSGGGLLAVGKDRLDELNARIRRGELRHGCGRQVEVELAEAVASSDGRFVYPVIDGIFVLLPSLAVACRSDGPAAGPLDLPGETDSVMRFYDEVGWRRTGGGEFADAEKFEDLRPASADYIHKCHIRVGRHIPAAGRFLLDVASGPIQYREYLAYSERYEYRICGDISLAALRAAKEKLGERGVYVQCDITRLPLKDGCVDGFVSLHTIYHVPAERQALAFQELQRVLADGKSGVVVYSWGRHCIAMRLLAAAGLPFILMKRAMKAISGRLARRPRNAGDKDAGRPISDTPTGRQPQLYFHPHSYKWFRKNVAADAGWDLGVWRSVSVPFMKLFIHGRAGTRLLAAIFRLEESMPRLLARLGQYPMMIYTKNGTKR
ncbi:MAG: class I SAM-dependent methyltransferase [Planctomycetes bacterium]|nr:class I SAM-dependent methyltransferase [Planctomycetota bacterium]